MTDQILKPIDPAAKLVKVQFRGFWAEDPIREGEKVFVTDVDGPDGLRWRCNKRGAPHLTKGTRFYPMAHADEGWRYDGERGFLVTEVSAGEARRHFEGNPHPLPELHTLSGATREETHKVVMPPSLMTDPEQRALVRGRKGAAPAREKAPDAPKAPSTPKEPPAGPAPQKERPKSKPRGAPKSKEDVVREVAEGEVPHGEGSEEPQG